jgi:hypothetical protein
MDHLIVPHYVTPGLTKKVRLAKEKLHGTNTLAYYDNSQIMGIKVL